MKTVLAAITIGALIGLIGTACGSPTPPPSGSFGTLVPSGTMAAPTETPEVDPQVTPTPMVTPDSRVSMTERLGMVGTTRTYVVESTRFIYEGRFLAVANQQARTECSETTLPLEDFDMLWKTLYRNDALTLADNEEG